MATPVGQMNIVLSANAVTFSQAIDQAQKKLDDLGGKSRQFGHTTVSSVQAASGALRELNGDFSHNIRAVERFITTIPGVGDALKAAFPLVGGIAFGTMLLDLGLKVRTFITDMQQMPEKIRTSFREIQTSAQLANDQLRLTNDRLANEISKLQGKPQNNLAIAFDEARIKADSLARSMAEVAQKEQEILEKNKVGALGLFVGKDSTAEVSGSVNSFRKDMADLAFRASQATRGGDSAEARSLQTQLDAKQKAYGDWLDKQISGRSAPVLPGNIDVGGPLGGILAPFLGKAATHVGQSANLEILRGERMNLNDETDRQGLQNQNAKLESQRQAAEASRAANEAAKRAAEERLRGMETALEQDKLTHERSIKDEYDYWNARRNAFAAGSAQYNSILAKQVTLAEQGANRAREAIKKFQGNPGRDASEDLRAMQEIARTQEEMRKGAVQSAGERNQDAVDSNRLAIVDVQNEAREREAQLTDRAGRSMTQYAAAVQIAQVHAQEFAQQMEALQAILGIKEAQQAITPSKENAKAVADAQAAIIEAQSARNRQGLSDSDAVYGRSSSGVVGATDALNAFIKATQDSAETMKSLTSGALTDFNRTLVDVLTAPHRAGSHFASNEFKGLGRGLATSVASAGLSKGEGMLLGALGLGGGKKPTGGPGDPLHVIMDGGFGATAATSTASKLLTGATGAATSSGASSGFFSSLISALPAFAEGGGIDAGTAALIGERGPEIFMPKQAGTVIPNRMLKGGGGDTHHYWNIDASGSQDPAATDAAVRRGIYAAMPQIVSTTIRAHDQRQQRRPLSAR